MRRQWEILEAGGRHILLAAEDGGRLVGSVMGVVCEELYGDGRPFLVVENLIVDKGERRKGAGRMLLRELEKAASARNCAQMILVTEEERRTPAGFTRHMALTGGIGGIKRRSRGAMYKKEKTMDELYTLYRPCFPDYPAAEAVFRECLKRERGQVLYAGEGGETVGYALIHGGSLSLLCVDRRYRNRGHGAALLEAAETRIRASGADRVLLGRGRYYLLQGVPAEDPAVPAFFERRGYAASWTSVNMRLDLRGFGAGRLDHPAGAGDGRAPIRAGRRPGRPARRRGGRAAGLARRVYHLRRSGPAGRGSRGRPGICHSVPRRRAVFPSG